MRFEDIYERYDKRELKMPDRPWQIRDTKDINEKIHGQRSFFLIKKEELPQPIKRDIKRRSVIEPIIGCAKNEGLERELSLNSSISIYSPSLY
jgi:hypothetical protein